MSKEILEGGGGRRQEEKGESTEENGDLQFFLKKKIQSKFNQTTFRRGYFGLEFRFSRPLSLKASFAHCLEEERRDVRT